MSKKSFHLQVKAFFLSADFIAREPEIIAIFSSHKSVSYTHLDVYKRQALPLWTK